MIWLLPKLWKAIKGIFRFIGRLFGGSKAVPEEEAENEIEATTSKVIESDGSNLDKLERLKHLFDSGTLTEEEFAEEKRNILAT